MAEQMIELTDEQSRLLALGVKYLAQAEHRELLIEGAAGTGKTTLIAFMVEALKKHLNKESGQYYSVVLSAPTNKAVEVLRNKRLHLTSKAYDFCTLHSALGLKYKIDEKTGTETFEPDQGGKKTNGHTILVVDEASMIGTKLLKYLGSEIKKNPRLKVIYIGDQEQLPPVNEATSPIFTKGLHSLSLTQVIRQAAGNPIIELSNNLTLLTTLQDRWQERGGSEGQGYRFSQDIERVIRHFVANRDDVSIRHLAYTNKCVNDFNNLVLREIYHHPRKVELGETIIMDRPFETIMGDPWDEKQRILFANNEEVLVEEVEIREEEVTLPKNKKGAKEKVHLKYYWVNDCLPILHEESEASFAELLEMIRRKAMNKDLFWKDYFATQNLFVAFKHRYALTVHKSQGSTYREVYINYDDILNNRDSVELQKMLYTAITRASNHLTILTSRVGYGR